MREITTPPNKLRRKTDIHGLLTELKGVPNVREIADELERRINVTTPNSERWYLDNQLSEADSRVEVVAQQYWKNAYERMRTQCRRSCDSLAVMFVDINDLGIYNKQVDSATGIDYGYGHDQGDLAIRTVAEVLHRPLDGEDRLLRRGGDEFVVLRKNKFRQRSQLETAVGNYLRSFGRIEVPQHPNIRNANGEYKPGHGHGSVTVSIGAALYCDGEPVAKDIDLLRTAEDMMLIAKANSKRENTSVGVVYSIENNTILK